MTGMGAHKNHLDIIRLVDILGIHMGLVTDYTSSVAGPDTSTETQPTPPAPAPDDDLETIIASVILSGSLDDDEHYNVSQVEGDKVVKFDDKDSPSIPAAEETVGEVNRMTYYTMTS